MKLVQDGANAVRFLRDQEDVEEEAADDLAGLIAVNCSQA